MRIVAFAVCLVFASAVSANQNENVEHLSGIMSELIEGRPNHVLNRNPDMRDLLAAEILRASTEFPSAFPELLVFVSYKESDFNPKALGDDGRSKGVMQLGFVTRKVCRQELGADLRKREHQIKCGAYWIHRLAKECGTLQRGLAAYSSKGGRCGGTPRGARVARYRIRMAKKIRKRRDKSLEK